jgi:hypothetical protein
MRTKDDAVYDRIQGDKILQRMLDKLSPREAAVALRKMLSEVEELA